MYDCDAIVCGAEATARASTFVGDAQLSSVTINEKTTVCSRLQSIDFSPAMDTVFAHQ